MLTVDDKYYKRYLATLDNFPEWYQKVLAHGVRYSLSVQAFSGLLDSRPNSSRTHSNRAPP